MSGKNAAQPPVDKSTQQRFTKELLQWLGARQAVNVEGLTEVEDILKKSHSNYQVGLARLALTDVHKNVLLNQRGEKLMADTLKNSQYDTEPGVLPETLPALPGGKHATVRIDPDGELEFFAVVGSQYTVVQNETLVLDALEIARLSENEGYISYAGNFRRGRVFFTAVGFDPITVDIGSHKETFNRSLVVYYGHDGELAHHFGYRFEDIDTGQVLGWHVESNKHYSKVQNRVETAAGKVKSMKYLSDVLTLQVKEMAQIQLPPESEVTKRLMSFCLSHLTTDKKITSRNREGYEYQLRELYLSDAHSGRRGYNGWALYTAFVALDDRERSRMEGTEGGFKLMKNFNYAKNRNKVRHEIMSAFLKEK
jgi:hypothetical protein